MARETAQYNRIRDAVEKLKSDAAQIEESIQEYAKTESNRYRLDSEPFSG